MGGRAGRRGSCPGAETPSAPPAPREAFTFCELKECVQWYRMSLTSAPAGPCAASGAPPLCSSCIPAMAGCAGAGGLGCRRGAAPQSGSGGSCGRLLPLGRARSGTNGPLGSVVSPATKPRRRGACARHLASGARRSPARRDCTLLGGNRVNRGPDDHSE